MQQTIRRGKADRGENEQGFTLIELMVVLLIMAILLAIAIPTFLGTKVGAQDRSAQSNLANALISAKTIYTNSSSGWPVESSILTTLGTQEPEFSFISSAVGSASGQNTISINRLDGSTVVMDDYSQSGTCWAVADNESTSPDSNLPTGVSYANALPTSGACPALTSFTGANWSSSFPTGTPTATTW